MAYKSAKKPHAGDFKPGNTLGKSGRPLGARNKATLAMEELLDGEAEALTRKAIGMALAGDMTAMRLCLERLSPPRKDRPISLDLPSIKGMEGDLKKGHIAQAIDSVLDKTLNGDITPMEAQSILDIMDSVDKRHKEQFLSNVSNVKTATAKELADSMDIVIKEFVNGHIDRETANESMKMLISKRDFILATDLEDRVQKLEQSVSQ